MLTLRPLEEGRTVLRIGARAQNGGAIGIRRLSAATQNGAAEPGAADQETDRAQKPGAFSS
jgi:hypothetical protein